MSYLHIACPWCGQSYTTGVQGSTLVGTGHACEASKPCAYPGCDASGNVLSIVAQQWRADELPEELNEREMATAEFRCGEHIDGRTILQFQPRRRVEAMGGWGVVETLRVRG